MNKMKRVFSLVLVLSMILGSFGAALPVVHAAEGANVATEELKKVPKDVMGTEYEKAVSRLVAFGVLGLVATYILNPIFLGWIYKCCFR